MIGHLWSWMKGSAVLLLVALAIVPAVAEDWSTYDWSQEREVLGEPGESTDQAIEKARQAVARSSMQATMSTVGFDIDAGSTAEDYLQKVAQAAGGGYYSASAGGQLTQIMDDAAAGRPPTARGPEAGELVICRAVVNGAPMGAGTVFERIPEIALFHRYSGQTPGQAEAVWFRDGNELVRSTTQIQGGDGHAWFTLRGGGGGLLQDGRYEVALLMPGRPAARKSFTIGQPGAMVAPAPAPAPPQPAPAPTPAPAPAPAQNEEIIVCREVVNGEPVGAASAFADAAKIAILHRYRDQAAGTAEAVWLRNGAELTRSQREIGAGNGWVSFSVMGGGGGSLPAGNYEVILSMPGRAPLRTSFTIGGAQG